jgi:RNA polymerase sigma-70 factor (ECF subfamily)
LKDVLFRLAFRITLNKEDAEDIVQETLIRLWNETKTQEIENIKSFGLTTCRNLALDHNKKRERQNITLEEDLHEQEDVSNQPDRLIESKERFGFLTALINELPEKQRTAIQLRDVEGRSYKEISDIMQITESDVKVNIFRARQKLKDKLQKSFKRNA